MLNTIIALTKNYKDMYEGNNEGFNRIYDALLRYKEEVLPASEIQKEVLELFKKLVEEEPQPTPPTISKEEVDNRTKDYFAGKALEGMLALGCNRYGWYANEGSTGACKAYNLAEDMMEEREKRNKK